MGLGVDQPPERLDDARLGPLDRLAARALAPDPALGDRPGVVELAPAGRRRRPGHAGQRRHGGQAAAPQRLRLRREVAPPLRLVQHRQDGSDPLPCGSVDLHAPIVALGAI